MIKVKKLVLIHPRKVAKIMKTFSETACSLGYSFKIKNGDYFASYLWGNYNKGAVITYNFDELTNFSQKQFRKNFVSRCKVAKGFSDVVLILLHEIGHYQTEQISYSYNRREAIKRLQETYSDDVINFEYFKLPDEKAATDWAIDWLSNTENRKLAKAFEKKFFACFKKSA